MIYVNAYLVSRNYGGPEEGGWWFDSGEPIASIPADTEDAAEKIRDELRERYKDLQPRYPRWSVRGGEDVEIYIEDHFARAFPLEAPHYE